MQVLKISPEEFATYKLGFDEIRNRFLTVRNLNGNDYTFKISEFETVKTAKELYRERFARDLSDDHGHDIPLELMNFIKENDSPVDNDEDNVPVSDDKKLSEVGFEFLVVLPTFEGAVPEFYAQYSTLGRDKAGLIYNTIEEKVKLVYEYSVATANEYDDSLINRKNVVHSRKIMYFVDSDVCYRYLILLLDKQLDEHVKDKQFRCPLRHALEIFTNGARRFCKNEIDALVERFERGCHEINCWLYLKAFCVCFAFALTKSCKYSDDDIDEIISRIVIAHSSSPLPLDTVSKMIRKNACTATAEKWASEWKERMVIPMQEDLKEEANEEGCAYWWKPSKTAFELGFVRKVDIEA